MTGQRLRHSSVPPPSPGSRRGRGGAAASNRVLSRDGAKVLALVTPGAGNGAIARLLQRGPERVQRIDLTADKWEHIAKGGWSLVNDRPVGYHWTGLGADAYIEQDPNAARVPVNNRRAYQTEVRIRPAKQAALETKLKNDLHLPQRPNLGNSLNRTKTSTFFPDGWQESDLRLTITSARPRVVGSQDYIPEKGAGSAKTGKAAGAKAATGVPAMVLGTNAESAYPADRR